MRITIDIGAGDLKQIQKLTGEKKKSPAVVLARADYLRQQQRQRFIEKAIRGQTHFSLTNEELEARDV